MIIDASKLNDEDVLRALQTGHARLGFSQLGEDAVLWHLFKGKRDGFYVDIGCHHPYRFSNTAIFYNFYNWSGLNVDVDEDLIAAFTTARSRDINLCAAVGRECGTAQVTFFHEPAVNSLDPATVEAFKQHFKPRAVKTVEVRPLRDILAAHLQDGQHIDLLTVDVEGLDVDVLLSNDWERFKPDVVAVEVHNFNLSDPGANPSFQILTAQGYTFNSHVVLTSIYTRI